MSVKKIEAKNPGWQFNKKISKRASKSVLNAATKSQLDIDSYNIKYAKQVKSKKGLSDSAPHKMNDKSWKMMKKESREKFSDLPEDTKTGFYDAEGNEVASQG